MPTDSARRTKRAAPWPNQTAAAKLPLWLVVVAALLLALTFALERFVFADQAQSAAAPAAARKTVVINEIMSSNRSAFTDDKGRYSDWFELYNISGERVDVTGWSVVDGESRLVGFTFPEQTLESGECVLIYASGNLKNVKGYPYHAPFKLSAQGDSLTLRDKSGAVVDFLAFPAMTGNQVYARNEHTGAFVLTMMYTPGMRNTASNHQQLALSAGSASGFLVINELMADNETYRVSAEGDGHYDYIEILNQGAASVDLTGYMLSDDEGRPGKWAFPGRTIGPGETVLVAASGLSKAGETGELHASFKLSSLGETVVLSDPSGRMIDRVSLPALENDRAFSRVAEGAFTKDFPPTPGFANDAGGLAATERALTDSNSTKLFINEAMASSRKPNATKSTGDWLELFNASGAAIDLTGYGLSDDPSQPRKWQFPAGAQIAPEQYLVVQLTGEDKANVQKSAYAANFKISYAEGETLTLATPEGKVIDRLPMLGQRAAVSYGRMPGKNGYFYMTEPTMGAMNGGAGYTYRAGEVTFSRDGGWFDGGVTVELTAGAGQVIRYTLDASEPGENSPVYERPIAVSQNTVVRARAYGQDMLPSLTYTQSYFFGERHALPFISLVADPAYLFDEKIGIYSEGPTKLKYPYKGANFWKSWERAGSVELYSPTGDQVLSQGAGLMLQGQYSRMEKQKAFKLVARNAYGAPRFDASLFPNRPFDSYKSFILRSSGQDTNKTRFRDAVLVTLAEKTDVFYQDAAPVVVYLNGEYWGHYNMRERVHKYSIAQHEGWKNPEIIDIVKANDSVKQGTNADYAQFLTWLKKNGCTSPENMAKVEAMVDVDNYLDYVAIEMYIGNTDLLNVKRYRSAEGDGRWKWVLYDTDWAFYTDTDSYRRWLDKNGAGSGKKTDNTLFVQLMKNPEVKKKFLRRFGELMFTSWRSDLVNAKIDAFARLIEPEMARQSAKWGGSVKRWKSAVNSFKSYSNARPKKMLGYIRKELGFTNSQMREYFGEIMDYLGM